MVLSRTDVEAAHKRHVAKQYGLFMVGKWEGRAELFKKVEESKWGTKKEARKAARAEAKKRRDAGRQLTLEEEGLLAEEEETQASASETEGQKSAEGVDGEKKAEEGEGEAKAEGEAKDVEKEGEKAVAGKPVKRMFTRYGVEIVPPGPEKIERMKKVLAKVRDMASEEIVLPSVAEELFALTEGNDGEETDSRIGVTGINHHYFAEDHGVNRYKSQLYDSVFGKGEEEVGEIQARTKLRGMLMDHKLLPNLHSGLWQTTDVFRWDEWARDEKDMQPGQPGAWSSLDADQVAEVVYEVVQRGAAPDTMTPEESEKEWARRAKLTKQIQATRKTTKELPIEWVSKTYYEPNWTDDDAKRRWRERKVVIKVKLDALELPKLVRKRLEKVLGTRYANGVAKVVADKYDTKEENRLYSLLLFRALLTDAFDAHPRFVRVNETKKSLLAQHNAQLRDTIAKEAEFPLNVIFSVRYH